MSLSSGHLCLSFFPFSRYFLLYSCLLSQNKNLTFNKYYITSWDTWEVSYLSRLLPNFLNPFLLKCISVSTAVTKQEFGEEFTSQMALPSICFPPDTGLEETRSRLGVKL